MRRSSLSLLFAGVLALTLAACSDDAPEQTTATQPTAPQSTPAETAPAPEPELPPETEAELNARADAAVQEQRLFAPPGDNAFELYVRVTEANAENTFARNALTDLFPYAVMHVEQRLAARDAEEANRVLALMERANAKAPALPRLRKEVDTLRSRIEADAAAELARQERAAQEAAAAAAAAAAQPVEPEPAPATTATPPPSQPATPPPQTASVTPPAPATTRPEPAAPATPRLAPGELPRVVRSPQPRYPPLALRRGLEGFVEVSFTVQPDGSVTDVNVERSEPGNIFNREAISAMQNWQFEASGQTTQGRRVFDFKLAR